MSETVDVKKKTLANPFPGLRPFSIDESHLFFGREGQSDEVLLKLSKNRFIGVIGPSGSGKSSFIYCGVLPILYGGFLTDTGPNWDVVVMRPGNAPIDNLAHSILEKDNSYKQAGEEEQKIKRTITNTLLRSSSLGLVEAIIQTKRSSNNNYLILVDQFEELFRFKDSRENENSLNETLAFVNLLMEAVNYVEVPIYVAITMRSDFIGECAQFPDLTKKINDSHYLIPQLTREQKRRAITGPVQVGGGEIAQRLTQQLLNDLGDNPDQLPILQHALMRTWDYWSRYRERDEPMDLKHYEAIGRMAEALSMHANEAYDELNDEQKEICEVLFKAITEKRGENFGIRRPTRAGEIAAIADVSVEDVLTIIEKFRQPGRSLLTPPYGVPLSEKSVVDISHESLMRIWVRLKNWVDNEADAVLMYQRLAEAATMYQVGKSGLWRPPDLTLALNWQEKHKPTLVWGQRYHPAFERTMVFLEYSKKEYETEQKIKELQAKRALKRARMTALIMGGATVISIMFLLFAFAQKVAADQQRELAVSAAQEAERQKVLADENAVEANKQRAEADIQKQAAVESADLATEAQLLAQERERDALEQKAIADQQRTLADAAAIRANKEADRATQEAERARLAQIAAEAAQARAERLRYEAQAKAMAIKATQTIPDPNLKGLLAQQAYLFNTAYEGYPYDADIYGGLYAAINELRDPMVNDLAGHDQGAGVRGLTSSKVINFIYSGGVDGKILIWNLVTGNWLADTLSKDRGRQIRTLATSSDGKWLAVGGASGFPSKAYLELFDLQNTNNPPTPVEGFVSDVSDLKFVDDNKLLIGLGNEGKTIRSYNFATTTPIIESTAKIWQISVSPNGRWIAGALENGKVMLWDRQSGLAAAELYDNTSTYPLYAIAFSADGKYLATGDQRGWVRMFNMTNYSGGKLAPERTLSDHTAIVGNIKFSSDGRFMATASNDKFVKLWNLAALDEQPANLEFPDWVFSIAFSPDNSQIMAGTKDRVIKAFPTQIIAMSDKICGKITRNMSVDEWETYVGDDLPYEKTCKEYPDGEGAELGKTPLEIKGSSR
jgi:WD40 repeat protein/energy-coupling factor transporter ATP-binding protein EcfA2